MPSTPTGYGSPRRRSRLAVSIFTSVCLIGLTATPLLAAPIDKASLNVSDGFLPIADLGFHDYTRDGSVRDIRNDLTGDLSGMVELAQASTSDATGNDAQSKPTTVADRDALLLFTPTDEVASLEVEVRVGSEVMGTLAMSHPNRLPGSDQSYGDRDTVSYSLRTWSAKLPWNWVKPGMELRFGDGTGAQGSVNKIDIAAPKEIVINNIRLGMLTEAPVSSNHRFIEDPANGATDYFQTIPVSKMTMAKYDTVNLDKVIVGNGSIYTVDNPDPGEGGVYSGKMREDVGKAQVSTGINLATWGITSSPMSQKQPGSTNQRVIHHSAGRYSNGVHNHGLSGGNGMATLYGSVGNELSHELGHSYGLGHYPGTDNNAEGDDKIRNASHHMDSGWGYISYRNLMRSNLSLGNYKNPIDINGYTFSENLAGKYNFNKDAMAGGWDTSSISDYTHHTAWSLNRIQGYLKNLVADTSYPSGYRDWDTAKGAWADARELNQSFDMPKPVSVGESVFTILGGYNPANAAQTLVYPAFRSNYGVTFDLPQADVANNDPARQCWLQVDFANQATQYISLDASDGVKQLNVNIAEAHKPTAAQVSCRTAGVTTTLGNKISIATDLEPMAKAVVVGQEAGYNALRTEELAALEPKLEALANNSSVVLGANDMIKLSGWADDLSLLNERARTSAERLLALQADAKDVQAYLSEHAQSMIDGSRKSRETLLTFLESKGYAEADGAVLPPAQRVTIEGGKCLYIGEESDQKIAKVNVDSVDCATTPNDKWYIDAGGRIHSAMMADLCLSSASPVKLVNCTSNDMAQRWNLSDENVVTKADDANKALDYNRQKSYAGMYSVNGATNQVWTEFGKSTNPLLAVLDGATIKTYMAALDEANLLKPNPDPEEEKPEPAPGEGEGSSEVKPPIVPEPSESPTEPESPGESPAPTDPAVPEPSETPTDPAVPEPSETTTDPAVPGESPAPDPSSLPDPDATEAPVAPEASVAPEAPATNGADNTVENSVPNREDGTATNALEGESTVAPEPTNAPSAGAGTGAAAADSDAEEAKSLATTGAQVGGVAIVAVLALLAGFVLFLRARRKA